MLSAVSTRERPGKKLGGKITITERKVRKTIWKKTLLAVCPDLVIKRETRAF